MRVTVFKNIATERNPSMQLYAEQLMDNMPSNVEGFTMNAVNLPFLRHYLAKEFLYPKIASKNQLDVNHISDHSYCGLLKTLNPGKTVVTCHDLTPLLYPETVSAPGRIVYWHNISLLPRAKRIIVASEFTKQKVIEKFGAGLEDIIRKVAYGVDGVFKPIDKKDELRKKYNIRGKSILHIGKSYKHKNIDAILKLIKNNKEYQLVKIGPFLKNHTEYIRLNKVQEQILHLPYIDPKQIYKIVDIYNCVGALVLPSLYEGFGLPILEAMACGCPVACSDIPPYREIAQDAAVFFDPLDHNGIEDALGAIFQNKDMKSNFTNKGLAIAKKYNWKICAQNTYKVYQEVYKESQ